MLSRLRMAWAAVAVSLMLMVIPLAMPATAHAGILDSIKCGVMLDPESTSCSTEEGSSKINNLVKAIVNLFSVIVGIMSVIMIIYGGFRYVTSGGDTNKVTAAKNTIMYALIGLVIVAMAQFIVQFVLNKLVE